MDLKLSGSSLQGELWRVAAQLEELPDAPESGFRLLVPPSLRQRLPQSIVGLQVVGEIVQDGLVDGDRVGPTALHREGDGLLGEVPLYLRAAFYF